MKFWDLCKILPSPNQSMNKENGEERYDMQKAGTLMVQAKHNAKLKESGTCR
jgi:hypothetical protein